MKQKTKVLFVCLGNICRSPLAEGIFLEKVQQLGQKDAFVGDSAGTAGYHIGENPDIRSIEVAQKHGITLKHKGRKFVQEDFERFDHIFVMDRNNYEDVVSLALGKSEWIQKVKRMRDFDPFPEMGNVPDPYYGGMEGFENVFLMLERSIDAFLASLDPREN